MTAQGRAYAIVLALLVAAMLLSACNWNDCCRTQEGCWITGHAGCWGQR